MDWNFANLVKKKKKNFLKKMIKLQPIGKNEHGTCYRTSFGQRQVTLSPPYQSWKAYYNLATSMERRHYKVVMLPTTLVKSSFLASPTPSLKKFLKKRQCRCTSYYAMDRASLLLYCIELGSTYPPVFAMLGDCWKPKDKVHLSKTIVSLPYLLQQAIQLNPYCVETSPILKIARHYRLSSFSLKLPHVTQVHWQHGIELLVHFLNHDNKHSVEALLLLATLLKESDDDAQRVTLWHQSFSRHDLLQYQIHKTHAEYAKGMVSALEWTDRFDHAHAPLTSFSLLYKAKAYKQVLTFFLSIKNTFVLCC